MRDIKNIFKLTLKRYGLWILLLSVFIAANIGLKQKGDIDRSVDEFRHGTLEMANEVGDDFDALNTKIDQSYIDKSIEISKKYIKKNDLAGYLKARDLSEEEMDQFMAGFNEKNGIWEKIATYDSWSWSLEDVTKWNQPYRDKYNTHSYSQGLESFVNNLTLPTIVFVIILGALITSLEQSLAYYDFTMMYPWKKKDEVWMKALVIFVIGLVLMAINLIIGMATLKSSELGAIVNFSAIWQPISKTILGLLGASIITIATGMIAGNFLGHGGLLIIAAGGLDLLHTIAIVSVESFSTSLSSQMSKSYDQFVEKVPSFFKTFISFFRLEDTYESYIGLIILGIIWAIVAYIINAKTSAEKSGYMIISRPVEIITKVIAIFALGTLINVVIGSAFFADTSYLLNIIVFALGLLISKKLFDILFKVRLKF